MHESLGTVLERLERIAAYDGPWRPLRDEGPLLRERLRELRQRESRLDDLLVVALVGGSGVGKSTLLNAIAGDALAPVSEFRPCTDVPTVYQPPGTRMAFTDWRVVTGSALEHLVIIDTPDSDTVVKEHREIVATALGQSDLILLCGSPEKYLDAATYSLLDPLEGQRAIVCVETKATPDHPSVRAHWLERLEEKAVPVEAYFRVSALRAFERKLAGGPPDDSEFEFPEFERYLQQELTRERVGRIKRSNALGLLVKTLGTLKEHVAARRPEIAALTSMLDEHDRAAALEACEQLRLRLFAEPHLWTFALGRELSLRAKGVIGTLYRAVEAVRTAPIRWSSRLLTPWRHGLGRQAARALKGGDNEEAGGIRFPGTWKTSRRALRNGTVRATANWPWRLLVRGSSRRSRMKDSRLSPGDLRAGGCCGCFAGPHTTEWRGTRGG